MTTIQTRSHTGPDGILTLSLPTEIKDADVDVTVVMRPAVKEEKTLSQAEWLERMSRLMGSIDDPTFRRQEQPPINERLSFDE